MPRRLSTSLLLLLAGLTVPVAGLRADDLEVVISGVREPVLGNVRTLVEPFRLTGAGRLSRRRLEAFRVRAEDNARLALRPYGYYHPAVDARIVSAGERAWRLELNIDPGSPVIVAAAAVEVSGPGADLEELKAWRRSWPLQPGAVLVQPVWDEQKQNALDLAADRGYLLASFPRKRMAIDLERNEARLDLQLDTGERAVMGKVTFRQDVVRSSILQSVPRFAPGDPYDAWLMERFRIDLWRTGYFRNIEVVEQRDLDASPPRVDLDVRLEARPPNTWQGTVGVGSDTGIRGQLSWDRHLISERGDSFRLNTGWQAHNNQFVVQGGYRVPRETRSRQAWIAEAMLKRETQDLLIRDSIEDETLFDLGSNDYDDYSLRTGRQRVYDWQRGYRQLFETMYAQYLYERVDFRPAPDVRVRGQGSSSFILGVEYDMPYSTGQGFDIQGFHHRAWAFVSNEAWGSDLDFAQAYVATNWNFRAGERWKFLFRGELGYTDAEVRRIDTVIEGRPVALSVTTLPNLFRFKAGGSTSVRGYGYERLSNNNIGSNHIFTASAEAEYRVLQNWSVAAFMDVGNAFNDWSEASPKKGIGFGVRWYTIAGAVRFDVARALDLTGEPWRIHFTIGTSLL
ncbi:MAG: BamA/TamA family outer membrane protein [Xanthomonadales bacterium]